MGFRINDFVRVRYDTPLLIGRELSDQQRRKLIQYIGKAGWVRIIAGRTVNVFFPVLQRAAWFDDAVLEEAL
jgi:hypothetical protein